jgi:hypothetical protein
MFLLRRKLADASLAACAAAVCATACAASGTVPAAGSWGTAIEVPGLAALNKGNAAVDTLSCASAGNCVAGGYYSPHDAPLNGFVASETSGVWGPAIGVPGLAALTKDGDAQVTSVSCASPGNCAAGGTYLSAQGFVVSETSGVWSPAIGVPGLAALNTGGDVQVTSVSCASAGNCAAGGSYTGHRSGQEGFVVSERNGRWGNATRVPGLEALNIGLQAQVTSVSCGSAGSCAAAGYYGARDAVNQGFVVNKRHGRWGKAIEVPGLAALTKGDGSEVDSVSCASAGNCSAGGTYHAGRRGWQGFVTTERDGRWSTATGVPGLAALNKSGFAEVSSVWCTSAGNCAAGGDYLAGFGHPRGFVTTEHNGVWGTAIEMPGLTNRAASVTSVSCASAGTCAASGYYTDRSHYTHVFVASEDNGIWGTAIQVPGLATLNKGGEQTALDPPVSCAPAGTCTAGGYYTDAAHHTQAFVVTQTG